MCNFRGKPYLDHVNAEITEGDAARTGTSAPARAEVREMPGPGFGGEHNPCERHDDLGVLHGMVCITASPAWPGPESNTICFFFFFF